MLPPDFKRGTCGFSYQPLCKTGAFFIPFFQVSYLFFKLNVKESSFISPSVTSYTSILQDLTSLLSKWTKAPSLCYYLRSGSHLLPELSQLTPNCVCVLVNQSCLTLCDPIDCSPPGSFVHVIFQQEYWSGLPFPSGGNLPNPGVRPRSSALQADALPPEPPGKLTANWSPLLALLSKPLPASVRVIF